MTALERFAPRPGGERDAILGVRPRLVFAPPSNEEAAALIAETRAQGLSLGFMGGGNDLELGTAFEHLDALVRSERLDRILEHAPSDQIATVQAGVPLAALQRQLAASTQRLALDPPAAATRTLGGILATNAFGALRTRYGSIRDLVLGVSFVRADGALVRGGGRVVKNVAGFDLPKLMVGSLGTLGFITEVTLRLHPLPEASVSLLARALAPSALRASIARLREAQLEPAAVFALSAAQGLDLVLRFEGFEAGVREQLARCHTILSELCACDVLDAASAQALGARHDRVRSEGALRAKFAAPANSIQALASDILAPLLASLERPSWLFYPTLGLGFVAGGVADAAASEQLAASVRAARVRLLALGGSLVLTAAPKETRAHCDVWGTPSAAFPLMQALKARLDPERRFARGRFVGAL